MGRGRGPVGKAQTKLKTPVQVQRREKVRHSGAHREKEGTCQQSTDQAKNPSTGSAAGKGAPLRSTYGRRRGPVSKAQTKLKTPVQVQRREKVRHSFTHWEKEVTCGKSADQAKNPSTGSAAGKGAPLIYTLGEGGDMWAKRRPS